MKGCRKRSYGGWEARVKIKKNRVNLGSFRTELEAADAIKRADAIIAECKNEDDAIKRIKKEVKLRPRSTNNSTGERCIHKDSEGRYVYDKTIKKKRHKALFKTLEEARDLRLKMDNAKSDSERMALMPKSIRSKGEVMVVEFLEGAEIEFSEQKTFADCVHKARLRFDFYLIDYGACVEFHGKQHYEVVEFFSNHKEQKKRDKIKKDYCLDNNIPFLEIRYDDCISSKLTDFISKLENEQ